jgi:hypothetical protein
VRHGSRAASRRGLRLKPRIAPKLLLKPFAGFKVADRLALAFDVAALSGGPIKDGIGRLDQTGRFKLSQKIASADEIDPFVNDGAAPLDVGVLEKQKRPRLCVGAEKSLQRLDRGCSPSPRIERPSSRRRCGRCRYPSE